MILVLWISESSEFFDPLNLCYTHSMNYKRLLYTVLLLLPSLIVSLLFLTPYSRLILSGVKGLPTPSYALDIGSVYPLTKFTLGQYVSPIVAFAVVLAGVIAFLLMIGGGVMIIAGAGNPQQQERGKAAITYGVVGLAIVVSAYWIVQIVQALTGLNLLNPSL